MKKITRIILFPFKLFLPKTSSRIDVGGGIGTSNNSFYDSISGGWRFGQLFATLFALAKILMLSFCNIVNTFFLSIFLDEPITFI